MRGVALALIAAALLLACLRWGSFVAGGSDSYCYIHQAERWAEVFTHPLSARLQVPEPLALDAPWPDAALAFAPAGHVPSRSVPGAIVPVCAAGTSMAMAPFVLIAGPRAAYLAVPLFGVLLVLGTYAVGARYGARIGLAAALVTACSPAFLYQVMQPMSDVPAAALWLLAVAGATGTRPRHVALAGLATSGAILVRPNLVPLGFVIGLYLLFRPERTWRQRIRAAATYAASSLPGCLAVAAVQQALYGSPLSSGYGSLDALFAVEHIAPNLRLYLWWLWDTHTFAIVLAAAAPLLLPGALTLLLAVLFVTNLALYLPYVVFDHWSYLRFLLPTLPLLLILVVAALDATWRRAGFGQAKPVVAAAAVVLAALFAGTAENRSAFALGALEARFARAGEYVARRLPPHALVITSWQSGSVRFYGRRKSLVWDGLPPERLDEAIAFVRERGYEPYLLFERREEPLFRERFRGSSVAALDWPPMADVAGQVRIYRLQDRIAYAQGMRVATEYVR